MTVNDLYLRGNMAKCNSCGGEVIGRAPCPYCGSVQELDLNKLGAFKVEDSDSDRLCPCCDIPLRTINVGHGENFNIEQCTSCYGLFFDPDELEALMNKSTSEVYSIKLQKIDKLSDQNFMDDKIVYRKCPICRTLMNRKNFGGRSGIIIDICKDHGIWLDRGELSALLEWKKAGGEILKEKMEQKRAKQLKHKAVQKHQDYISDMSKAERGNKYMATSWLETSLSVLIDLIT